MNYRNLILAGLLCGLASCAVEPPQPPPVIQQPPPVVQQQTRTQQQVDAQRRVNSSVLFCTGHGNDLLECELRAQLMETCLETQNYAPCSNLPPMQHASAPPKPRETECQWGAFQSWVCSER